MPHNAFHDFILTCFSGFIFLIPVLQLSLIISSICPVVLCNYANACIPWNTSHSQLHNMELGLGLQVTNHVLPPTVKSSLITLQKQRQITLNFVTSQTLTMSFLSLYFPKQDCLVIIGT